MTKLPPPNSALYKRIIKHAGKARGQVLTLTKTEMWEVPKENVDAVKKAAAEHGANATQLGSDWNQVFHKAPADMKMNDKQKTMMEHAKASKSTMGVGMMATPMAPMVEYALTKDAGPNIGGPATSKEAARITIKLSDKTELTIVRTSVDIKTDMCIWRGAVEGTDAPATIMWWPGGKMAGTLQHEGRIYSIRHMGGEMHAVVEMGEDRMPQEHAPMPERMRANDPNLRDDPLCNRATPASCGRRPRRAAAGKTQQQAKLQQPSGRPEGDGSERPTSEEHGAGRRPKDIVIDVIVAYTKKAASNYSDVKRELVDLSIEEANESFRMSGIGHVKLRLVHAYQTDYVEEGAHFDHVWRFADKGDGYMEEIHALRDKYRADVAILIVDDPKGCGLATRVYADAEEAFAVVHHECAAASYYAGARDRPPHRRPPRSQPRQEHDAVPLRPRLRQRHQVARHHELQGELRRLPAPAGVVEPDDQGQGRAGRHAGARQRPRDRGAGRARRRLPVAAGPAKDDPAHNVHP